MGNCPIFAEKSIIFGLLFGRWARPLWSGIREMCLLNADYSEIGPFGREDTPRIKMWAIDHLWLGFMFRPTHLVALSRFAGARLICATGLFVGLILGISLGPMIPLSILDLSVVTT